jgi:hypothetical protein
VGMFKFFAICLFFVISENLVLAQWKPSPELSSIQIVEDCSKTRGEAAAVSGPPVVQQRTIYYCPKAAQEIDAASPGASHFFYVHEFAHHALNRMDERMADCWAVGELKKSPNGSNYLNAVIKYLKDRGQEYNPRFGTMLERADRIARCASENGLVLKGYEDPRARGSKRYPVALRIWPGGLGNSGAEMEVYVDGKHVGLISNLLLQETVELGELSPGEHEFKLENIVGYKFDQFGDVTPFVTGLMGRGKFTVSGQRVYKLVINNLIPNAKAVEAVFK